MKHTLKNHLIILSFTCLKGTKILAVISDFTKYRYRP